jgi:hypothetical protein
MSGRRVSPNGPPGIALFFFVAFAAIIMGAGYLGKLSPIYLPLPLLDLKQSNHWGLDWRLAQLASDQHLCRATLTSAQIKASPVPDRTPQPGCGWSNAVAIRTIADANMNIDEVSCPMAAALALWMTHVVQPAAREYLGHQVVAIRHLGAYACRNINGSPQWRQSKSQHAAANALDIAGFMLADGRTITISKDWQSPSGFAPFLKRIHSGACRYFRVVLGPDYNAAHRDHFHLDRGAFRTCR